MDGAESGGKRMYDDREIDAVVEMSDGRWAAMEIKLGVNQEDAAAEKDGYLTVTLKAECLEQIGEEVPIDMNEEKD